MAGRHGLTATAIQILALTYVGSLRSPNSRTVTTQTRPPDPKPFPLPTPQEQKSSARDAAPPMHPQQSLEDFPSAKPSERENKPISVDPVPKSAEVETTKLAQVNPDLSMAVDKKSDKKLTLYQKIKKEIAHYWDGTKLLGKEIRISFRLALKMAAGYELSRRESRQLERTTQDLIRLVPFSVFVIVPFAELLLPVALKLFPNMLPSTYEGEKAKEAKRAKLSKTRKDVSNFLRTTIQECGFKISKATKQSEEFAEFFKKVCV